MIESLRKLTPRQRLGGLALALVAGAVFGNGLMQQDDVAPAPAPRDKPARAAGAAPAPAASAPTVMLALEKLRRHAAAGEVADLFAGPSWVAKPAPPAPAPPPPPPAPAPPPTAPPLPFTYIGQMQEEGERTMYYLERGPQVLTVTAGETIDNTYRVEGTREGRLEFTYLPLNTRQGLPVGSE